MTTFVQGSMVTGTVPTATNATTSTTQAVDTNTTAIATTAFVLGQSAAATPLVESGAGAVGTSTRFARADHVHPAVAASSKTLLQTVTATGTAPVVFDAAAMTSYSELLITCYDTGVQATTVGYLSWVLSVDGGSTYSSTNTSYSGFAGDSSATPSTPTATLPQGGAVVFTTLTTGVKGAFFTARFINMNATSGQKAFVGDGVASQSGARGYGSAYVVDAAIIAAPVNAIKMVFSTIAVSPTPAQISATVYAASGNVFKLWGIN